MIGKKDRFFIVFLVAVVGALLAPALLRPDWILGNFGDIVSYHLPLRHLSAAGVQAGRMPFWNPYVFGGLPLLANSQAALFHPLSIPFLVLPAGLAFTVHAALHLVLAALGMYLLLRLKRLDAGMSCLLAAAFVLSPFIVYRIPQGVPTLLAALAYVPWCWLALFSGRAGFLAAVWALQFLSGHPQFALINAGGMGIYLLIEDRKRLGAFFRAGAFAGGLCLVQAVVTAEFLARSNRGGLPEQFITAYSMPLSALGTLLRPGFAGDPLAGSFASVPSLFIEAYATYVGLIPLALALLAFLPVRDKDRLDGPGGLPSPAVCWLLVGTGVFLALGTYNPLVRWTQGLPVAGLSRVPARFALLAVWGLLLAAAAGWTRVRAVWKPRPWWKAAALLVLLAEMGMWSSRFVYAEDPSLMLVPNERVVRALGDKPVRFVSDPEMANPNKAMLYRAMNLNGYEAYYLGSYMRYVARSEAPRPSVDPSRTHIRDASSEGMRRLAGAYSLSIRKPAEVSGEGVVVGGPFKLYHHPGALPLAYVASRRKFHSALSARAETPERWTVSGRMPDPAPADARLVLSVPHYPGWRARLDGRPVAVSAYDGLVQTVPLEGVRPGEEFRADFVFRPTGWTALCLITALVWLMLGALVPGGLRA